MSKKPPITTVAHVDLPRFMGPWYVIASIPIFVEKDATNAVETYTLDPDGTIATTFTFNQKRFDGKLKKYKSRGFVRDKQSNAVWGVQFFWPFKGDYRIAYLDKDYTQTVIARKQRDYVWMMARGPLIPETDYQLMLNVIAGLGYDISKVRKVPQQAR